MFNADKSLEVEPAVSQATGEATVPVTLAEVVALVADDAQCAADQYLDETVVPHGGE